MSGRPDGLWRVVLQPLLVWTGLLAGLAAEAIWAFAGGPAPLAVDLALCAAMDGALLLLFMGMDAASPLIRAAAAAGALWLFFLFSLSFGDYLTRPPGSVAWRQAPGEACAALGPAGRAASPCLPARG